MIAPEPVSRIPILRLYDDIIVVLQGAMNDRMINQLKEEIPRALDRYDAKGVVISVAGVDVMDSYISRMIYDVAVASRLMGVDTVVCGIGGLVAQTLVEMGMDMGGVPTELNLERALETLANRRHRRVADAFADEAEGDLDLDGEVLGQGRSGGG